MGILDKIQALFGSSRKFKSQLQQGMQQAKQHKFHNAIDLYTKILGAAKAPDDVKAMAQFNRALAYSSMSDYESAEKELHAILADPKFPANVKSAAQEKLTRYEKLKDISEPDLG
ncbi:MAG: hypothetical protein MK165_19125 [Pirellulaceae bacterium]|nr:hypothetical protein [Pirellulaceae bacterium]